MCIRDSSYGEDEASPPWKTAEELLALTYKYFKINDPELEALTLKQIFEQNLQDKVLIAHPMRIIHRIKNLNVQDPDEAARARLLIFGDRNFKTPVIEAASSNASAGDMTLTHLNNDFKEQRETARRALLLEQDGTEFQLSQNAKQSTQCMTKMKPLAIAQSIAARSAKPQKEFNAEEFAELVAENNRKQGRATSGLTPENAELMGKSIGECSGVNSASALRNVLTRLPGPDSKANTSVGVGQTSAKHRELKMGQMQGASRHSAGVFGQSPDPTESRGNLTHRAAVPYSNWTTDWVAYWATDVAEGLIRDVLDFPVNFMNEILNYQWAEHEVFIRLSQVALVTHGGGTDQTDASNAFYAKLIQLIKDLGQTGMYAFDAKSLANPYVVAFTSQRMVSALELNSCRHAATHLLNVIEDHVSSRDFKDDTYKRIATVFNLQFLMEGVSPAISLQVAMSDLSKIIHEGITTNASALRDDSETHTCLSPEMLLQKLKLELQYCRTQNQSASAPTTVLNKAIKMLEDYEEDVREKRFEKIAKQNLVLNSFLLFFQANSTALQELDTLKLSYEEVQEKLNGPLVNAYFGVSPTSAKGNNGKGKGKGGQRKNNNQQDPQRKATSDEAKQSFVNDPARRDTDGRPVEADFEPLSKSAMHLSLIHI